MELDEGESITAARFHRAPEKRKRGATAWPIKQIIDETGVADGALNGYWLHKKSQRKIPAR